MTAPPPLPPGCPRTRSSGALEWEAATGPLRHAAADDVHDVREAVALQQRRRDRRALARGADRRDRTVAVEAVRRLAQVVVGRVRRTGDVAAVPFGALADVEDLQLAVVAVVQGGDRPALDALTVPPRLG